MQRSVMLLVLLLICSGFTAAQPLNRQYVAELRRQLNSNSVDTNTFLHLQKLGEYYLNRIPVRDLDSAGYYFQMAARLIKKLPQHAVKYSIANLKCQAQLEDKKHQVGRMKKLMFEVIRIQQETADKNGEADTWKAFAIMLLMQEKFTDYGAPIDSMFRKSYKLYRITGNIPKQVELQYWIISYLQQRSKNAEAEQAALKVLSDYKRTPVSYFADLYGVISKANRYRGNYNKSLYYSLKSIELMAKTGDYTREGNFYGELAEVYQELGQTENSIIWYRKTIRAREKTNIPQRFLFRTAGFLAHELILQKRPAEALNEILQLERRHQPDNLVDIGTLSQIKAYCYEAMGKIKLAEYHYLKMMRLFNRNTILELITFAHYDLAKFYVKQGRYKEAERYLAGLDQTTELVSKKKDIELLAFKIDSASGNYLRAIQHIRNYEQLKDSIFSTEKSKQIEELQIRYQTSENEQSIRLLKKDSLLSAARIKDANNLRNVTLVGLLVLFLFLAVLFFSYRSKQRSNIEINKKNESLRQLVSEKEWLIKEVHHRVKNNLQIVMGLLQRQSAYVDNEKALLAIQNSEHRMHSIALIHQKLYQSETMALINMPDYIDELIDYLKDSFDTGSRIRFSKHIENFELDVQHAVPLGLILNEAITNAIKYAFEPDETGDIQITMITEDDLQLKLIIADNGRGLPVGFKLAEANSLGFNLMRGLSKQLGGKLIVEKNNGTSIKVLFSKKEIVPLNRKYQKHESYG